MERAPLVPAAVACAIGTAAALPLTFEQRAVAASIALGLAFFALHSRVTRAFIICVLVAAALGYGDARLHGRKGVAFDQLHTRRYAASVLSSTATGFHSFESTVQLDSGPVLLAALPDQMPVGTHVLLRGRFTPFDPPRNPGEPDQGLIENERGLDGTLAGARVLGVLPAGRPSPRVLLARLHQLALERLRHTTAEPYASILAGELWGEKSSLPLTLRAEFQDSGTVHVLVTAGLHLGVVAWLTILLMQWLRLPRFGACAAAAAIVWTYAAFSGLHLPAMRAAGMITFALGARAAGAKALSWNALAAAALLALVADPQCIRSASFAMSFSCVGAIFLAGPVLRDALNRVAALPVLAAETLTLSIATQAGVWPVTAATFLLFAPYSVVANALVVPLVGLTMFLGALQIVCADILPLAQCAANLNTWALHFMVSVVQNVAALPHAHVVMTPPPLWTIALYDAALIAAVWLVRRRGFTPAGALLLVACFIAIWPPVRSGGALKITVLDVGQADAIVVRTPAGHALLVDAGGRLERGPQPAGDSMAERVGETIVAPFLIRAGVHHLDAILLSHPHGDHAGGVAPVLRQLGADAFADSGQSYGGYAYNDALTVARSQAIPIAYPRSGTTWRTDDGVSLTFFGPSSPFITGSRNDINNNSIVFMLQYRSFRMLFTGDAGAQAEQRILDEGVDLKAAVLKVGHHGSAYSSTPAFIETVHPKYAIISVGRHNLFGHPAPQTLDTLERFGARIYRTDEDGAVTITSGGGNVSIGSML